MFAILRFTESNEFEYLVGHGVWSTILADACTFAVWSDADAIAELVGGRAVDASAAELLVF